MTGLLLHINYELFMRVHTDGFPELLILAQQELLRQTPDGGMEWPYQRRNAEKEALALEENTTLKPL